MDQFLSQPLRSRRSGLSLIEVMVTCALLGLIATFVLYVFLQSSRGGRGLESQSDAYRNCMLCLRQIRRELRGAEVIQPATVGVNSMQLQYRAPQVSGDLLQVDALGGPVWQDLALVQLAPSGQLLRAQKGQADQLLGKLGTAGEATFTRKNTSLLEILLRSSLYDGKRLKSYQVSYAFFMENQAP